MSYYPEDAPAFEMSEGAKYDQPGPMPDSVLIEIQETVDWIEKARPRDVFMVEKISSACYKVMRFRRAA
jgi:hypothetical protein